LNDAIFELAVGGFSAAEGLAPVFPGGLLNDVVHRFLKHNDSVGVDAPPSLSKLLLANDAPHPPTSFPFARSFSRSRPSPSLRLLGELWRIDRARLTCVCLRALLPGPIRWRGAWTA
jgi:hypothetical protein